MHNKEIKVLSWENVVHHTSTLMLFKARKGLCNLFSTNQGNGSKWYLWQEQPRSTSKRSPC